MQTRKFIAAKNALSSVAKTFLGCLGILIIFSTLAGKTGSAFGSVDFLITIGLGLYLIINPYRGLSTLVAYFLFMGIMIGVPLAGAYVGVVLFGKDSIGAISGFIAGLILLFHSGNLIALIGKLLHRKK